MRIIHLIFGFLFILSSCSSDFGNKIQGGELTVHYPKSKDVEMAKQVALFWKDNDFLTGKPQDLQLLSEDNRFVLKIIASEYKMESFEISIEEKMTLLKLQKKLNDQLLGDTPKVLEIEIAKNNFETIENINE